MPSGIVIQNTFPPEISGIKPSYGLRIQRMGRSKNSGDIVIIGPNISKIRLAVERPRAEQWVERNRGHIASLRSTWARRAWPRLLVVLEEWTCTTWTHIHWSSKDCFQRPTNVGLVRGGRDATPQWRYFGFQDQGLSLLSMKGNPRVSSRFIFSVLIRRNCPMKLWWLSTECHIWILIQNLYCLYSLSFELRFRI